MSFAPADFPGFGGLNLAADAEDSPGAIDLSNVTLSQPSPSRLLPRPGYTLAGTLDLSAMSAIIRCTISTDTTYIVAAGSTMTRVAEDGSSVATKTNYNNAADPWSLVAHGSTADATVYGANGTNLGRYTSAAGFTAPTVDTKSVGGTSFSNTGVAAPKPIALGVQPKDNRLVAGGFPSSTYGPNGAVSAYAYVYFSQPDDPTKWDESDFVVLSPGDGEKIRAMASYGDLLLVFKESKFFVFYGNSVDSTGGAVFNYRSVGNAFGGSSSAIYQGQVCSAPSGVYVITDTGVWKTTGGAPQLVSAALTPLFRQNVSTLQYAGTGYTKLAPRSATGSGGAFWHQGRVFFSVTITRSTATTSSGWLILDEQSGQWTVWELADTPRVGASAAGAAVFPSGVATTGRKGLLSMDGTATTDNETAISSYYTSPYLAYGEPKAEKHVRAAELHGTGTVTLAWGKDLQTHGTAETVAMSSGIGHARTGARGRVLSFKIAASAAGWTVNRVVPMLQTVRTGK